MLKCSFSNTKVVKCFDVDLKRIRLTTEPDADLPYMQSLDISLKKKQEVKKQISVLVTFGAMISAKEKAVKNARITETSEKSE